MKWAKPEYCSKCVQAAGSVALDKKRKTQGPTQSQTKQGTGAPHAPPLHTIKGAGGWANSISRLSCKLKLIPPTTLLSVRWWHSELVNG